VLRSVERRFQRCFRVNGAGLRLSVEMLIDSYIPYDFYGYLPTIYQHIQHTYKTHINKHG